MPDGFATPGGLLRSLVSCQFMFPQIAYVLYLTLVFFFFFFFSLHPSKIIIDEQASFLRKVWDIPFEERKWKDLVTLDTLHAFCGGLELMPVA